MNRKGAFTHWIVLIALAAIVFFLITSRSFTPDQELVGSWHYDFLKNYVYEAEKQSLQLEKIAHLASDGAVVEFSDAVFSSDLGCGLVEGMIKLNTPDTFCSFDARHRYLESFHSHLSPLNSQLDIQYELSLIDEGVIGRVKEPIVFSSNGSRERYENNKKSFEDLGMEVDEGLLEKISKEELMVYSFRPDFHWSLPAEVLALESLEQEARVLVASCRDAVNLENCLSGKDLTILSPGLCIVPGFKETDRQVIFCADLQEDRQLLLDFTPGRPLPLPLSAVKQGNRFELRFPYSEKAQSYAIYVSNAESLLGYEGDAAAINVLESAGEFLLKKEFVNDNLERSCIAVSLEVPYLCDDELVYALELDQAEQLYGAASYTSEKGTSPLAGFILFNK
ncbi:hypothetical protein COV20_04810 [Candidatus Woesearchaeota archaeon CG10_big_fil_rev_8_21_14_0_10_45_16]|nr:MAG: hypothetical protein COV20_04810 [Candidatus Woesearchaeota archaeon CG10_big_fil_rev_8_21_14_0_10_45_16]